MNINNYIMAGIGIVSGGLIILLVVEHMAQKLRRKISGR